LPSPKGEGGPAGPDEGQLYRNQTQMGYNGKVAPHQSASRTASPEGEASSQELAISNVLTNIPAYDTLPKAIRE